MPGRLKTIRGLPRGKLRVRFRELDFAFAYVRTTDGIKAFHLEEHGTHWTAVLVGQNFRTTV